MLDPIRDSWEDRIRSVRMSSKNLVGENAENCKKVSKNQYTNAVKFRAQNNQDSIRSKAKKGGISGSSHHTKILDLERSG